MVQLLKCLVVVLLGKYIRDVIPWMSVQALFQSLLVHVMPNETYRTPQNEQRIDGPDINILLRLLTANMKNFNLRSCPRAELTL
jgi:hypothetical protein